MRGGLKGNPLFQDLSAKQIRARLGQVQKEKIHRIKKLKLL